MSSVPGMNSRADAPLVGLKKITKNPVWPWSVTTVHHSSMPENGRCEAAVDGEGGEMPHGGSVSVTQGTRACER